MQVQYSDFFHADAGDFTSWIQIPHWRLVTWTTFITDYKWNYNQNHVHGYTKTLYQFDPVTEGNILEEDIPATSNEIE